jgi:hypothetical protein
MQELLEEMEREGLIEKTGELRANPETGEPRPVCPYLPRSMAKAGKG